MRKISMKKNAVFNAVRVLMTVIFPLITFPYATRVLGVDNMGKIQFGLSIISYFSLFAALGVSFYGTREAAVLRDNKKAFSRLASEIFTINLLTTIVSYIFLAFLLFLPTELANYRELIFIQSIVIISNTIGVEWVFSAIENYFVIAMRSIVSQFVALVLLFIFVKKPDDYYLYAAISVIASAGVNIFNFIYARRYCDIRITRKINIKKHIGPLFVLFSNALAVQIYINSDVVMLGLMKGDYNVGLYGVAVKIFTIVKSMINAVVAVTIPRLAFLSFKSEMEMKYRKLSSSIINSCATFVMPLLTLLFLLSDNIVVIVGGRDYAGGAMSLRILSVALVFAVMSNVFGNAILVSKKQEKKFLIATIVGAIANVVLNFVFIPLLAQDGAAITTVISEIIVMCISGFYAKKYCDLNGLPMTIFQSMIGCLIIIFIYIIIHSFMLNIVLEMILVAIISIILYFSVLIVLQNKYVIELIREGKKRINTRHHKQ